MEYHDLSLIEIRDLIKQGKASAEDVCKYFLNRIEAHKNLNAVVEVFSDALAQAKEIDVRLKKGEKLGELAGVPIAIKDNILFEGKHAGCASQFLKDFVAPYSASLVKKLLAAGAVIIGRTNMDEFAMGSSTENTCYGVCHNAVDPTRVAGGSSGGSAVSVAAGLVPCAIGTDTGGSIRQPASFNGVVGVKPTYGTVSRYGIVAFASSLDQASPICKTVADCELVLKVIAGRDTHDNTTIENKFLPAPTRKLKLGIVKEVVDEIKKQGSLPEFESKLNKLKTEFELVDVSLSHITNALAVYYIIAPAEATSNLARFDGVKYTTRANGTKWLEDVYKKSRTEGFGSEVKRRIMLGNFVLSSGYFDAYYNKAKKVQNLIKAEFSEAFKKCDVILTPTTPGGAFKIGEKHGNPIDMYLEDLFTVPANIAGIPAISVPFGSDKNGMPLGLQLMASEQAEQTMFRAASTLEKLAKEGK